MNKMAKNGKQIAIGIGLVILVMIALQNDGKKEATALPLTAQAIPNTATFEGQALQSGEVWVVVAAVDTSGKKYQLQNVNMGGSGSTAMNRDGLYIRRNKEGGVMKINIYEDTFIIGNNQCFTGYMDFDVSLIQSSITTITVGTAQDFGLPIDWKTPYNANYCGHQGVLVPELLSECTPPEIRCIGSTTYNSCVDIGSGTFRFSGTEMCPTGDICSNNQCILDVSSLCSNYKSSASNSINSWISSPSASNRDNALAAINNWATSC